MDSRLHIPEIVVLMLLTAFIPGGILGQFLHLIFQQLIEGFLYANSTNSLSFPLITAFLIVESSQTWFTFSFEYLSRN